MGRSGSVPVFGRQQLYLLWARRAHEINVQHYSSHILMVLNLSHHVQADSGVHEEAIIHHHGCIFLHLFGVVLSRWEEPDHVGAGDVIPNLRLDSRLRRKPGNHRQMCLF